MVSIDSYHLIRMTASTKMAYVVLRAIFHIGVLVGVVLSDELDRFQIALFLPALEAIRLSNIIKNTSNQRFQRMDTDCPTAPQHLSLFSTYHGSMIH